MLLIPPLNKWIVEKLFSSTRVENLCVLSRYCWKLLIFLCLDYRFQFNTTDWLFFVIWTLIMFSFRTTWFPLEFFFLPLCYTRENSKIRLQVNTRCWPEICPQSSIHPAPWHTATTIQSVVLPSTPPTTPQSVVSPSTPLPQSSVYPAPWHPATTPQSAVLPSTPPHNRQSIQHPDTPPTTPPSVVLPSTPLTTPQSVVPPSTLTPSPSPHNRR